MTASRDFNASPVLRREQIKSTAIHPQTPNPAFVRALKFVSKFIQTRIDSSEDPVINRFNENFPDRASMTASCQRLEATAIVPRPPRALKEGVPSRCMLMPLTRHEHGTRHYFTIHCVLGGIKSASLQSMSVRRMIRKFDDATPELLNGLILSLGGIFLLFGVLQSGVPSDWRAASAGVGGSLISTAIVAYLTSRYLQKREARDIMLKLWGISGIYQTRAEMNEVLNHSLPHTKTIEVCAFGMRNFRSRFGDLIRERVRNNLKFTILVPNPQSQFVFERNRDEGNPDGQLTREVEDLISWCRELQEAAARSRRNVTVRVYDRPLLDFYFRVDDMVCVGPYLYGRVSQQTISYTFLNGSRGYTYWTSYFGQLWNDRGFCRDAL